MFEDQRTWLQYVGGGLHYFKSGVDQGELGTGAAALSWLDLSDTPGAFGAAGFSVVVNALADGLEFVNVNPTPGGDLPAGTMANQGLRWNGSIWTPTTRTRMGGAYLGVASPDQALATSGEFRLGPVGAFITRSTSNANRNIISWAPGPGGPNNNVDLLLGANTLDVAMLQARRIGFFTSDTLDAVSQPVLPLGSNTDAVISALQALGLVSQS